MIVSAQQDPAFDGVEAFAFERLNHGIGFHALRVGNRREKHLRADVVDACLELFTSGAFTFDDDGACETGKTNSGAAETVEG